jgi:hypothetical protein
MGYDHPALDPLNSIFYQSLSISRLQPSDQSNEPKF